MKNFFKRLFCRHDWCATEINEFETGMGTDNYIKAIGETTVCRKCGKKVFIWAKSPFGVRTLW